MKRFLISATDLAFLSLQARVPLIRVVAYDRTTGEPIYGYTDPTNGRVVELGRLGSFDLMSSSWAQFLPPVVTFGALTGTTTAATGAEPLGLRNVQGLFNNLSSASSAGWGAAFNSFARNATADYSGYLQQSLGNNTIQLRSKADSQLQALINRLAGVADESFGGSTVPEAYALAVATPYARLTGLQKALVQDSTYGLTINSDTGSVDLAQRYANPFLTVWDYTPRMISQVVDSEAALRRTDQASGGTTYTDRIVPGGDAPDSGSSDLSLYLIHDLQGQIIPGGYDAGGHATAGGLYSREDFVRNLNTLSGDPSLTGWNTIFGQFFDHGLDFLSKGGNITLLPGADGVLGTADDVRSASKIVIGLDPSDPLYSPGQTKLSISRATVLNPEAAGLDGQFRTADDILSPGSDGAYGTADDILGPTDPLFENTTSPYIDQSQTYGSNDDVTNLLREWVLDPTQEGHYIPGMKLFDGRSLLNPWTRTNPDGSVEQVHDTLPTLNELRQHLQQTGRDDLSWGDINNLRARDSQGHVLDLDPTTDGLQAVFTGHVLIADLLPRLDQVHLLIPDPLGRTGTNDPLDGFSGIERPTEDTDSEHRYVSDYINLTTGQPTVFGLEPAQGAILNEILLRAIGDHYVAGDGRINENMGLTAMHHVWHENHNWQIDNLIVSIRSQQLADPTRTYAHQYQIKTDHTDAEGNYLTAPYNEQGVNRIAWNQELLFQEALLINQMEYQHVAIDQFARGMSPNIPLFVMYDSSVNADISVEFGQGAYRYGHSQLRETIDALDPTGSLTAMVTHYALEASFLNPEGFRTVGATALALGMTRQFSSEIDEMITPALQQKLLGQNQDLAAINIARGRDLGLPTLNALRRQLSGGMATHLMALQQKLAVNPDDPTLQKAVDQTISLQAGLTPYSSWSDFQAAMIHPEAVVNFIAAYSFDGDIDKAELVVGLANGSIHPAQLTDPQSAMLASLGWTSDNAANNAFAFMEGGDQGFERIDAWNGGLAEKHVFLGQLGPTFDAIFADQITRLINGDRFYYFWRLDLGLPQATQLLASVTTEQFKDVIERTTGARHLVGNVFFAADDYVELGEMASDITSGASRNHHYGDLVNSTGLGVASKLGVSDANNGRLITISGQQYIYDARPDQGVNPDGTARKGFNAHEVIGGTSNKDYIDAGDGDDTIYGDGDNDLLLGNAGADHIYGEDGIDLIYGGALPDFLDGGDGNDIIHGGDDADVLIGSDGNDTLFGENGVDELQGNQGNDILFCGNEMDVASGGDGEDAILGEEGLDTITGQWGDDQVFGGAGPDQCFGGDGDDILHPGTGANNQSLNVDEALGEGGFNLVSYSDLSVRLDRPADLNNQNINQLPFEPFSNLYVDIQGVEGTVFDDQMIGDSQDNWFIGGGGNDLLNGGAGDDVIVADSIKLSELNAWLLEDGRTTHFNDLQTSFPDFYLGDQINVGSTEVTYTRSIAGNLDTVTYAGAARNFQISQQRNQDGRLVGLRVVDITGAETGPAGDLLIGVERLVFGYDIAAVNATGNHTPIDPNTLPAATTVMVDSLINAPVLLNGLAAADTSDRTAPGWSEALQQAEAPNPPANVLRISLPQGVGPSFSPSSYQWYVRTPGSSRATAITGATDSSFSPGDDPTLFPVGSTFFATVSGVTSNGQLIISTSNSSDAMGHLVLGTSADDRVSGGTGAATSTAFQDVIYGGAGADQIDGLEGNDQLEGGSGNDSLDGGSGDDSLFGGRGNDLYGVDSLNDRIVENADEGIDGVLTSISLTLGDNLENLTLIGNDNLDGTGNAADNQLVGNAGNNRLAGEAGNDTLDGGDGDDTLEAGDGNDTLKGGAGNDSLNGGLGDDTYIVDDDTDSINEAADTGIDTVQSSINWILSTNLETLTLTGTGAINGTGNALNNILRGNGANNTLDGGSGNDTLEGGDGNDTLNGGTGNDSLLGGLGDDTYIVNAVGDLIDEATDAGIDRVQSSISWVLGANLENLTLTGTSAINGTGNELNNLLLGNSRANVLNGGEGNDTLNGGTGNDTLIGGLGDDLYIVDSTGDAISEGTAAGIDTVRSSLSWTLGNNLENLALIGSTGLNGTGNEAANTITGNAANNTLRGNGGQDSLDGGAGNDTLIGGIGADMLIGGAGNDRFVLSTLSDSLITGMDTITDFVIGTDTLDAPTAVAAGSIIRITSTSGQSFSADGVASALTTTNFAANRAALLSFSNGNYLAINNGTAGWNAATDAILHLTGNGSLNGLTIV